MEFPSDVRQFDYDTISDVILHLRYTAREGGGLLRNGAVANLKILIEEAQAAGSVRLFSIRHEFPTEWARFKNARLEGGAQALPLTLEFRPEHFPFWSQGRLEAVKRVDLFAKASDAVEIADAEDGARRRALTKDGAHGNLWRGQPTNLPGVDPGPPLSIQIKLFFIKNTLDDLWLAVVWGKAE